MLSTLVIIFESAPMAITMLFIRLIANNPLRVEIINKKEISVRSRFQQIIILIGAGVIHVAVIFALIWASYGFRYSAMKQFKPGRDQFLVPWEEVLKKEVNLTVERHDVGRKVFSGMGDAAPAFGMIGTLIGLVQMLASMDDPASIGPSMAIALLTTMYGAILANLIFLPIADKLALRSQEEERNRRLIVEGVLGILKGINPRVMEEFLETFLPPKDRGAGEKK